MGGLRADPERLAAHLGPALIAATLAVGFAHDSFLSWQFKLWVGLIAISCVYVWLYHRPLAITEKWLLAALLGSMALSTPGAILWGDGHWQITLMVVIWTGIPACLFAVQRPERVLWWLTPFIALHGLILAAQGNLGHEADWGSRLVGLHMNPNPAAALILVGVLFVAARGGKWWWLLALPMLIGMPWTGSRWALVSLAVVLGGYWLSLFWLSRGNLYNMAHAANADTNMPRPSKKDSTITTQSSALGPYIYRIKATRATLLIEAIRIRIFLYIPLLYNRAVVVGLLTLLCFAFAWAIQPDIIESNYRLGLGTERHGDDATRRLTHGHPWGWQDLIGRGYVVPVNDSLHNVPMRLSAQYGLLAALAWLGLVAVRLREGWGEKEPGFWLVLLVLVLSQQDYYFIMGQMAGLGWLILGWRASSAGTCPSVCRRPSKT